jgi:hypothetical protein
MDDLSRLADMAEIFGAAVVVGGLFFAIVQMRHLRQQRRELAAIELFRFFGSPQFSSAYREVLRLPDGLDVAGIRAHSPEAENCAMIISTTMENIGVMMYQRIVPSAVVKNLMGDSAGLLWRKLEVWITEIRADMDNPSAFEWFQWLAEILASLQDANEKPAYEQHKDWKPAGMTQEI